MDLNKLYETISSIYTKDEMQSIYYTKSKHDMEKWSKDEFNVSWYFLEKIILNFYRIEKKPKEIWKKQQIDHMWETKREKYPNGNYDYDKFKTTMDERYGGIGNASPQIFEKQKKTLYEQTGYEYACQLPQSQKGSHTEAAIRRGYETANKNRFKLKYDGLRFDSSWELAFYIYYKDHNLEIKKCDGSDYFEYYVNNVKHLYFPDFKIGDQYIEIKGDQFIDNNGELVPRFDRGDEAEKFRVKCKNKCMKDNNIKLLSFKDLEDKINYCIVKYNSRK